MHSGENRKLKRRLTRRAAFFAGFAGVSAALIAGMGGVIETGSDYHEQQQPISPVADLIERHDCWTGDAPADMTGVIPGHAVYTLPGGEPTYGPSQVGFDIWLNGRPGRLHAFCR